MAERITSTEIHHAITTLRQWETTARLQGKRGAQDRCRQIRELIQSLTGYTASATAEAQTREAENRA